MRLELHEDVVLVVLSRRNLLALPHKLEMPGSARTLLCSDNQAAPGIAGNPLLVVEAESDEEHYTTRPLSPGPMHPETERFLRETAASDKRVPPLEPAAGQGRVQ